MGKISFARFIAAPPKRVFEIATDFAQMPGRITAVRQLEVLTGGELRKGVKLRETRRTPGGEVTQDLTVTAVDAPHSYQVGYVSDGCRFETRYRFEPDGTGTNFVVEFGWRPLTLAAQLMSVFQNGTIRRNFQARDQDLDELKYAAEQRAVKAA